MPNWKQHTCCNKEEVKRGAWSPEEDEILRNYILANGLDKWTTLPQQAGLQRCGKSCRLRWMNHLKPDLKHGTFSDEEARLIVQLHEHVGNKWAYIATHLPGRTDNEIKNYWNSTLRKRVLSPQLNQQNPLQAAEDFQQQRLLQQHQQQQQFHLNIFLSLKKLFFDSAVDRLINIDKEWLSLAPPGSSRKGKEAAADDWSSYCS